MSGATHGNTMNSTAEALASMSHKNVVMDKRYYNQFYKYKESNAKLLKIK